MNLISGGTRSNTECITLPGDASSSKICIHWKDMKWSKKHFRGCVSANVQDVSNLIRKPRTSCYVLNCEEYKWGNKWVVPTEKPPQSALDMIFKGHKNKPDFSKPLKDLYSNFDPDTTEIRIKVSSPDKPRLKKPVEENNFDEHYFNSRVFDYIETLPSSNVRNPPPPSAKRDKPNNQNGNKPKLNKTPKPVNKRKEENKQQPGNKNGQGNASKTEGKQGIKSKPEKKNQQINKTKPGGKRKLGNNDNSENKHKPGNESKPGKNSQPANKTKTTRKPKPVGEHKPTEKINSKPHGKSPRDKLNIKKPVQTNGKINKHKLGERKSASLTIKQAVKGTEPGIHVNKEELLMHDGKIKRVGEISILTPLDPNDQDTVLAKPELFPFVPHNPDTQVVYVLETSEKYKQEMDD